MEREREGGGAQILANSARGALCLWCPHTYCKTVCSPLVKTDVLVDVLELLSSRGEVVAHIQCSVAQGEREGGGWRRETTSYGSLRH